MARALEGEGSSARRGFWYKLDVDSGHGKGSWTQKALVSQDSIMEAETDVCRSSALMVFIVPMCLCKAISAVMLETRACTWVVGK